MSISVFSQLVKLAYQMPIILRRSGPTPGLAQSLLLNVMDLVPAEISALVPPWEPVFLYLRPVAVLCQKHANYLKDMFCKFAM